MWETLMYREVVHSQKEIKIYLLDETMHPQTIPRSSPSEHDLVHQYDNPNAWINKIHRH